MPVKVCNNCNNYNPYYTKICTTLCKHEEGYCEKNNKSKKNNDTCKSWIQKNKNSAAFKKQVCLKKLPVLLEQLTCIAQTMKEGAEELRTAEEQEHIPECPAP